MLFPLTVILTLSSFACGSFNSDYLWKCSTVEEIKSQSSNVKYIKLRNKTSDDFLFLKKMSGESYKGNYQNEVDVLSSIPKHPFIGTLVAHHADEYNYFQILTTSMKNSMSLMDALEKRNFGWKRGFDTELRLVALQLREALLFLNQFGIHHNDLKPQNIIYDEESGRIMLVDFGISSLGFEIKQWGGTEGYHHQTAFPYFQTFSALWLKNLKDSRVKRDFEIALREGKQDAMGLAGTLLAIWNSKKNPTSNWRIPLVAGYKFDCSDNNEITEYKIYTEISSTIDLPPNDSKYGKLRSLILSLMHDGYFGIKHDEFWSSEENNEAFALLKDLKGDSASADSLVVDDLKKLKLKSDALQSEIQSLRNEVGKTDELQLKYDELQLKYNELQSQIQSLKEKGSKFDNDDKKQHSGALKSFGSVNFLLFQSLVISAFLL